MKTKRTRAGLLVLVLFTLLQPACIWKLWSKKPDPAEVVHDLYGTLVRMDSDELVIATQKGGQQNFILDSASILGGTIAPGATVHVYFKNRPEGLLVTMVVEKIG